MWIETVDGDAIQFDTCTLCHKQQRQIYLEDVPVTPKTDKTPVEFIRFLGLWERDILTQRDIEYWINGIPSESMV